MSEHEYQRSPLSLATGARHQVKLPPKVMRGRLTGFLFETNKTFLLPGALTGIRGLASFYAAHPGLKVLVTGHTDTVGASDANLRLSDERAAAVSAFLTDDVDAWLRHYGGTPGSSPWATREDQHMLAAVPDGGPPYYGGPIHGQLDPATQDAVRRFQTERALTVDGVPGPETRRALITDYMAIDGTSLPAGTEIARHGCGEHHPAVPTGDEVDEPSNRRVEVFFFEGPIAPRPQPRCPHPGCPEYPEWLRQTILTIDFTRPPPRLSNPRWDDVADGVALFSTRLLDWRGAPCAGRPVTVLVDGRAAFAVSDGRGVAKVPLPSGATRATVRYQPGEAAQLVELTAILDAPNLATDAGVHARLTNLGFEPEVDLATAIRGFQLAFQLPLTGRVDDATRARLAEIHDHGGGDG